MVSYLGELKSLFVINTALIYVQIDFDAGQFGKLSDSHLKTVDVKDLALQEYCDMVLNSINMNQFLLTSVWDLRSRST